MDALDKNVVDWFASDEDVNNAMLRLVREGVKNGQSTREIGQDIAEELIMPAIYDNAQGADVLRSLVNLIDWSEVIDGEIEEATEKMEQEKEQEIADEVWGDLTEDADAKAAVRDLMRALESTQKLTAEELGERIRLFVRTGAETLISQDAADVPWTRVGQAFIDLPPEDDEI